MDNTQLFFVVSSIVLLVYDQDHQTMYCEPNKISQFTATTLHKNYIPNWFSGLNIFLKIPEFIGFKGKIVSDNSSDITPMTAWKSLPNLKKYYNPKLSKGKNGEFVLKVCTIQFLKDRTEAFEEKATIYNERIEVSTIKAGCVIQ